MHFAHALQIVLTCVACLLLLLGYGYPHPGAFNPFMLNPAWLDAAYMTYGYADYFRHQQAAAAAVHHPALSKAATSPNGSNSGVISPGAAGGAAVPSAAAAADYPQAPSGVGAVPPASMMPSPPGGPPASAYAMPQFPFNHVAAAAAAAAHQNQKATPHAFHPYNFAAAAGLRARNAAAAALHHGGLSAVDASHMSPASSRPSSSSPTPTPTSMPHVLLKLNTSIETSSIHEQSASDADSDDEQIDVVKSEYELDKSIDSTRSSPTQQISVPLRMRCDLKAPSALKPLYHETAAAAAAAAAVAAVTAPRQASPETTLPAATKLKNAVVQQKTVWRPY